MARNRKNRQESATATATSAPVLDEAAKVAAEETARKVRDEQIATARSVYTAATGWRSIAKDGKLAGSDLVGRCLRACKLIDGKTFVTVEEVAQALRAADKGAVLSKIEAHISALVQNKANLARLDLFRTFVKADGLVHLATALETFAKYRAWQYGETVTMSNGTSINHVVDIRAEVTNLFGLRLTMARRAKYGSYQAV